jgi:hypothetical protein
MLFDQSDVDIGFAHRSDFGGHFEERLSVPATPPALRPAT